MPDDNTAAAPVAPPTSTTETTLERLARLRREKATRDEDADADEAARELAELELDAKLSAEVGRRGKDFEIVNTAFGVFGVRLPDTQGIAQLNKATKDTDNLNADKIAGIVRHYIVPEGKAQIEFHAAATERPDLAFRVATAIRALLGSEKLDAKKKF